METATALAERVRELEGERDRVRGALAHLAGKWMQ
jgi:hypothetical protein